MVNDARAFAAAVHDALESLGWSHDTLMAEKPISSALGSVQGLLEDLHLHKRNRFALYPMGDDDAVMCDFHPRLYEKVLRAVKKNVTVFGTLHYGLGKTYPVRVDVDDLEQHPSDDDLPSLLDMCGSLEDMEGDSVSIVRAMRDEW